MRRMNRAGVIPLPATILAALLGLTGEAAAEAAQPPAQTPFNPGIADLMNIIVQPRHTKLWYSGREGNWTLAEYHTKELRAAFANVARARPRFRDQPVAELIETFMSASLRSLDDVLKAKDAAKFPEAYAGINAGCNACHVAVGLPFIVIRTPEVPAYPDQEFRPPR